MTIKEFLVNGKRVLLYGNTLWQEMSAADDQLIDADEQVRGREIGRDEFIAKHGSDQPKKKRTVTCGNCMQKGHITKTCKNEPADPDAEAAAEIQQ